MLFKKYSLKDGSVCFHKLYYDIMPQFMTRYSPPLGSYNYAFYLYNPHKYVLDLYYEAKWFIQRGARGYSDRDAWGIDWYLCEWMPKALQQLRSTTHGHPIGLTEKSWELKIGRMVNAFKIARKIQNYDYRTSKEAQVAMKQFRKDFNVFKNYFFGLWD